MVPANLRRLGPKNLRPRKAHVKWDCKYHVVIVPKYRRRKFYGSLRSEIGKILRQLCRQAGIELVQGNALPDHVHLLLSVPPKYSIANTVGFLKGKSAIRINRDLGKVNGSLYGRAFWSRGYCVSTVGLDEAMIKEYIQNQEKHERDEERGLLELD